MDVEMEVYRGKKGTQIWSSFLLKYGWPRGEKSCFYDTEYAVSNLLKAELLNCF